VVDSQINCVKCQESTFLGSDKKCHKREYALGMIEHCLELQEDDDFCKSCELGYNLSSNKLTCLPLVSNCVTQSLSLSPTSSEIYKCTECDPSFLLNNDFNVCYTQISGCSEYDSSFAKCILCENSDYYLEVSGICSPRSFKSNYCEEYQPESDACQTCKESFALTSDYLECLPSINFCEVGKGFSYNNF
jgi:hypothetical protein